MSVPLLLQLLPWASVLVFNFTALLAGIATLYVGLRLDRVVPLRFVEFALPLYIVGAIVTWYGGLALGENLLQTRPLLHVEFQSVVMAVVGIMSFNVFWALYKYARQSVRRPAPMG